LVPQQPIVTTHGTSVTGILRMDTNGNAWCSHSNGQLSFIAPNDLLGAKDSEQVQVELHNRSDGKSSGKVIKILSKSNYSGFVVTDAVKNGNALYTHYFRKATIM
jgi:hypothetical protein